MPLPRTVSPSAQARGIDTTRRGRSGVVHSPHHGAHLGGNDGEHGTHAVRGHGVHHDDASDVAPIHVVRAVADHSTLVGHEMNRGEGSELHEGHVLCEALTGEVSKRYTHGIARAEVERGRTHAHGRPRWQDGPVATTSLW